MSKEDVEKLIAEFRATFEREDGLIDKYVYRDNPDEETGIETLSMPDAIAEWLRQKLTPLVAQKEQKEGVDYSMGMSALRCCDNGDLDEPHGCLKMPPTPTVKEESHTQGWNRAESEQCVRANVMHPENGSQESAVRYILEHFGVVIAAIASQEYQRGALYNHEGTFTRGFEAGRLQGIADAVAVVPNRCTEIGDQINASEGAFTPTAADIASEESWNNCRQAMLTALRSLTHNK